MTPRAQNRARRHQVMTRDVDKTTLHAGREVEAPKRISHAKSIVGR